MSCSLKVMHMYTGQASAVVHVHIQRNDDVISGHTILYNILQAIPRPEKGFLPCCL